MKYTQNEKILQVTDETLIVSTHCREKLSPIPKRTLLLSIF